MGTEKWFPIEKTQVFFLWRGQDSNPVASGTHSPADWIQHSETACVIQDHDKDLNGTSRAYDEYFAPSFFHSSRQPFLISRHRISEETRYLYLNACLRELWCRDDRWLSFAYTRSYRHSVRFLRSIKDNDQKHATRPILSIGSRSAGVQRREPGPRFQYPIRRLIVRSREVSKPRYW